MVFLFSSSIVLVLHCIMFFCTLGAECYIKIGDGLDFLSFLFFFFAVTRLLAGTTGFWSSEFSGCLLQKKKGNLGEVTG